MEGNQDKVIYDHGDDKRDYKSHELISYGYKKQLSNNAYPKYILKNSLALKKGRLHFKSLKKVINKFS